MLGYSYTVKSQSTRRVVVVKTPLNDGRFQTSLVEMPDGCELLETKFWIADGYVYTTLWIETAAETPFDGLDLAMPDGWDFRSLMSAKGDN